MDPPKKKHSKRSVVLKALQSFPAVSITDSLKESFLSFISFSWLKSMISSSRFSLVSRSPDASLECECQNNLGKADYRGAGAETPSGCICPCNSSALLCFLKTLQQWHGAANSPQTGAHSFTSVSFSVCGNGTVQTRVYYFASWRQEPSCTSKIAKLDYEERAWRNAAVGGSHGSLPCDPSSPLSSHLSLGIQCKFSTPTLWSVLAGWIAFPPLLLLRISPALCWSSLLRTNPFSRRWLHREYWLRWRFAAEKSLFKLPVTSDVK